MSCPDTKGRKGQRENRKKADADALASRKSLSLALYRNSVQLTYQYDA